VNRKELIDAAADEAGTTKANAERVLESIIGAIFKTLKKGDEVRIAGFGSFYVTKRAATEGRNPRTGEKIKIKASKLPKFRALKGFKDAIS
jgi:DNA-binding protein HU-beta